MYMEDMVKEAQVGSLEDQLNCYGMGKLILNIHRGSEDIPFSKLSRKVIFVCHS